MKRNHMGQYFSRNCVIALLSTTLALTPALAIATTIDDTTNDTNQIEQIETDEWSNQDYVNSLKGLTDAERAELKALYDKMDAYWDAWETDSSGADLTDAEWDRLTELEDKAFGYDEWDEDWDDEWSDEWYEEESQSNTEYVNSLKGLTDDERTELIALYDKLDAYWDSWGFEDESCGLSDAEWDRMAEIEDKAFYAELAENLTDAELTELKGLYDQLDALTENEDLTDEQWNRLFELVDKGYGTDESSYDA